MAEKGHAPEPFLLLPDQGSDMATFGFGRAIGEQSQQGAAPTLCLPEPDQW